MEINSFVFFALLVGVVVVIAVIVSAKSEKRKVFKDNTYKYTARDLLMSKTEAEFFTKLESVVEERYYVFPQVHLSSLLDHRIKGQEWRYAFRHINGKSVDYVLCDKRTLRPTYAIELDDYTHEQVDRRKRDSEVERIFDEAGIPLVRFKSKNVSENEIIQALTKANTLLKS